MGGDGSGGEHTKDPRIRRCGFGLVILEPQQVAGDCSKVAGDRSKLIRMVFVMALCLVPKIHIVLKPMSCSMPSLTRMVMRALFLTVRE